MKEDLRGKLICIAGGSSGLGKELALALAPRGADITILARRRKPLDEAKIEIQAVRQSDVQKINAVSVDMSDPAEVDNVFRSGPRLPDILYCVMGGTSSEIGFLTDISPQHLEGCMRNNYLTAAYAAQSLLKLWVEEDESRINRPLRRQRLRQIVFVASAAAFLGLPGYGAYTAPKCAVRGLADTLRMECIRLSNPSSTYTTHIAFPSNFISPAFLEEQKLKPMLTKRIEGTSAVSEAELAKKFPSSATVAAKIIHGVEKGEFALCDDSSESGVLFANMLGPSPKRGLGVVDSLVAVFAGLVIFPVYRRIWDRMCKKDGEEFRMAMKTKNVYEVE